MVYGELFWQEGLGVYELNDENLFHNYSVPEDHLLTGVLNVTYEYPIVTLLFFAGLSALEPGSFGPTHYLVNFVLVLLVHLNLVLFIYLGQEYTERKWFKQIFAFYYSIGFLYSVAFGKVEPLAEFLMLATLVLFKHNKKWIGFGTLALAVQAKIYPAMVFPILFSVAPLESTAFFVVTAVATIPLVLSGMSYSSLIAHLLNSPGYAQLITNPFYLGLIPMNPISTFGSLFLVWGFLCAITEVKKIGPIPLPSLKLRTRDWQTIYICALPLILLVVSWTQVWYYTWFIVPFLLIRTPEDMANFRYVFAGIWVAHFAGILLNIEYFLAGPIAEILEHLRPL